MTPDIPPSSITDMPADAEPEPSSSRALVPVDPVPARNTWVGRLLNLLGVGSNATSARQDIEDVLATREGDDEALSVKEKALLTNILRLRDTRIDDVMVERGEIHGAELSQTLGDVLRRLIESGHSRMPVYCETLDDPRGMVHIRDLLGYIVQQAGDAPAKPKRGEKGNGKQKPTGPQKTTVSQISDLSRADMSVTLEKSGLTRPILFAPPSMLAMDLMAHMQGARTQMALIIDEYGGTDGLVSLEDLVETVFGEIEDEHDDQVEQLISEVSTGVWGADSRAELEDVKAAIGPGFDVSDHEDEVDTLGGLLFASLGRIPVRGEIIHAVDGFEIEVTDADPRRIKKVRISRRKAGGRRKVAGG
ncbi:MAG: hemolysin family protein [Pseudomonadota bacterium]